jgi:hypothetical protein
MSILDLVQIFKSHQLAIPVPDVLVVVVDGTFLVEIARPIRHTWEK